MRDSSQLVSLSACQQKAAKASRGVQPCAPIRVHFLLYLCLSVFFLFAFAGCVPATIPSQLSATPGPAVVITDQIYDTGVFKVRYPADWRVITSAATSPSTVIFAAPDNEAIMLFGLDVNEAPMPETNAQIRTEMRLITLENGIIVTAILNAPDTAWAIFVPLFEQIVESVN